VASSAFLLYLCDRERNWGKEEFEETSEETRKSLEQPGSQESRMKDVGKKVNVYLPTLRMKVPDHVYVFGSLLLQ
jgi:hypothetical protein